MKSSHFTLILFLLASTALLMTGHVLHPKLSFWQVILVIWCGWSGTFAVYHIGSIFTHRQTRSAFLSNLNRKIGLTTFLLHLLILLPILCWIYLPAACFWIFFGIFAFGLLYSIPFQIGKSTRIIKRIILVKNVFIGISWAALILVGAGEVNCSAPTWWIFWFVATHIFMGSILRDHSDMIQDKKNGLLTLPLLVGLRKSYLLLSVFNVLVFTLFNFFLEGDFALIFTGIITLHKAVLLFGSARNPNSQLWTQTLNISFNYVIFLLAYILRYYGIS
jgi:4-hydroxybenzoate polyprenyltransferase